MMVDLDVFMDTRIATVAMRDPSMAEDLVSSKFDDYISRINDDILSVNGAAFKDMYSERNSDVLRISRPTVLGITLNNAITQMLMMGIDDPYNHGEPIELHVNMWPYKDLSELAIEHILIAISARIQHVVKIKAVCHSYGEISPKYLRDCGYKYLYMYNVGEWINSHYGPHMAVEGLYKYPELYVCGTMDFKSEESIKDLASYKNDSGETCDPRAGYAIMFIAYFHLDLVDKFVMSIAPPEFLVEHDPLNK